MHIAHWYSSVTLYPLSFRSSTNRATPFWWLTRFECYCCDAAELGILCS
jgi:hypothetical protein